MSPSVAMRGNSFWPPMPNAWCIWTSCGSTFGNQGTDGPFSDILSVMARLARIAVVNIPHHVTQRGNARQFILASDAERLVYLDLLRKYIQLHKLALLGTA